MQEQDRCADDSQPKYPEAFHTSAVVLQITYKKISANQNGREQNVIKCAGCVSGYILGGWSPRRGVRAQPSAQAQETSL